MSYVQTPLQLGILRFLLGAADGALLPAVQTLLVYNSSNQIAGRMAVGAQSPGNDILIGMSAGLLRRDLAPRHQLRH